MKSRNECCNLSIGLYIALAPLSLNYAGKLQEKRFDFIKTLANIISENLVEVSKIKYFKPNQQTLLTDGILGVFELPHLAIVIKCYISALAPGSWAAWAGDFASAVKETYVNAEVKEKPSSLFYTASKRIGAMEADVISITEARLFNYCDLIADIDGYAIRQLMLGNNSEYALSECIREYYSDVDCNTKT